MSKLGHVWGTLQELLHPRGYHGRWINKPHPLGPKLGKILESFNNRDFTSDEGAANYVYSHARSNRFLTNAGAQIEKFVHGYSNVQHGLRTGQLTPSDTAVRDAMDKGFSPLPDDLILSRVVGPEAFGLDPSNFAHIQNLEGEVIVDKGYVSANIGTPLDYPGPHVTMVIAARKGQPALMPSITRPTREVVLPREQPLAVTKVEPDGKGGFNMYVVPLSHEEAQHPELSGGPGFAQPSPQVNEPNAPAAPTPTPAPAAPTPAPAAPGAPSAGGPAPRNEPIHAETVGAQPSVPTTTPASAPGASTPPLPTTVPETRPDIRALVREAGIPAPSPGPRRKQWNEAFLAIALHKNKAHPEDVLRNLESDIKHNEDILAQDKIDGTDSGPLPGDIEAQKRLAELIRHNYIPAAHQRPQETPKPEAPSTPQAPSKPRVAVPKPTPQEKKAVADLGPNQQKEYHRLRREGQSHDQALTDAKKVESGSAPRKTEPTVTLPPVQKRARKAAEPKAPAEPGAAPQRVGSTAAGKQTTGRLQPGDKILVSQNKDGTWSPATRKTGATEITVTGKRSVAGEKTSAGTRASRARTVVEGITSDGTKIETASVPAHQTFFHTNAPKAEGTAPAKATKVAKAAAPSPVAPEAPAPPRRETKIKGTGEFKRPFFGNEKQDALDLIDKYLKEHGNDQVLNERVGTNVPSVNETIRHLRDQVEKDQADKNSVSLVLAHMGTRMGVSSDTKRPGADAPAHLGVALDELFKRQDAEAVAAKATRAVKGVKAAKAAEKVATTPSTPGIPRRGSVAWQEMKNHNLLQQALQDSKGVKGSDQEIGLQGSGTLQDVLRNFSKSPQNDRNLEEHLQRLADRYADKPEQSRFISDLISKFHSGEGAPTPVKAAKKAVKAAEPKKAVERTRKVSRSTVKNGDVLVWQPPGESPVVGHVFKEPGKSAQVRWEGGRVHSLGANEPNIRFANAEEAAAGKTAAATARQAEIDRMRRVSGFTKRAEELLANGSDAKAFGRHLDRYLQQHGVEGSDGEALRKAHEDLSKAVATGRVLTIRRAIDKINRENGISVVGGRSGEGVPFNPAHHRNIAGEGLTNGAASEVVQPAHELKLATGERVIEHGRVQAGSPAGGERPKTLPGSEPPAVARKVAAQKAVDQVVKQRSETRVGLWHKVFADNARGAGLADLPTDPKYRDQIDSALAKASDPVSMREQAAKLDDIASQMRADSLDQLKGLPPEDRVAGNPVADASRHLGAQAVSVERAARVMHEMAGKRKARPAKAEPVPASDHLLDHPRVSVAQVRRYAQDQGITVPNKVRRKADIIAHIKNQEALRLAAAKDVGSEVPHETVKEAAKQATGQIVLKHASGQIDILPPAVERRLRKLYDDHSQEQLAEAGKKLGIDIPQGSSKEETLTHLMRGVAQQQIKEAFDREAQRASRAAERDAKKAAKERAAARPSVRAIMKERNLEQPKSIPARRAVNQATSDLMAGHKPSEVQASLREQAKTMDPADAKILTGIADALGPVRGRTAAGPLTPEQLAKIKDVFANATNAQEARAYIEGLKPTIPQIRQIHEHLGFTGVGKTKKELTDNLIHFGVQARINHEVLSRGGMREDGTKAVEKAAETTVQAAQAKPGEIPSVMSIKPITKNNWGVSGGDVNFHPDGEIGQGLQHMGQDRHLNVDGEPLGNVLGRLATDLVRGNKDSNQVLTELRALESRMPSGSKAKEQIQNMIRRIDTPARAALKLPEGTPPQLADLMDRFSRIPLARRQGGDMDRLLSLAKEWQSRIQEYRSAGMSEEQIQKRVRSFLPDDLRSKIYNHNHESQEGKFEVDRAILEAIKQIRGD